MHAATDLSIWDEPRAMGTLLFDQNLGHFSAKICHFRFSIQDAFEEEDADEMIKVYGNGNANPKPSEEGSVKIRIDSENR